MMNERERRDFNAGLSDEVDAWLRGDTSRRSFLTKFVLMGGAAMLPGFGFTAATSEAWAEAVDISKVDLADKSTPLGPSPGRGGQGLDRGADRRLGLSRRAGGASYKAKNVTLNMTYEAGPAGARAANFSGPLWQELTGINYNVVELPHPDQYSKPIAEHIADSGAYDILDIEPAWIPALANGGVIAPIDDYVAKYMNKADLDDYHPLYKSMPTYKGKSWGFFDDGDQFALYYRKDIFDDPKLKEAYQAKFNKALRCRRPGTNTRRSPSSSPTRWRPTSMAPRISASSAAPATSSPSCSSSAPTAACSSTTTMKAQLGDAGGHTDAATDDRRKQGVDPRQQRARRRGAVGGLAAGQGGDDLLLAADGPHVGELCAARQGDQLHPAVEHRRQGRLRRRARRQRRDGVRLRQGAGRRLRQRRGRLSVHAMGDRPAGLARAHHAALYAARSVSPVALTSPSSIARCGRPRRTI